MKIPGTASIIKAKLREQGSTGLDLSPGDPIAAAAVEYIEWLEEKLEVADEYISKHRSISRVIETQPSNLT